MILVKSELKFTTNYCTSNPEKICKDWMNYFVSSSIDISNPILQEVWSKILAYEASSPKSITRRTLDFLKNISLLDLQLIESFFEFALLIPESKYGLILENEFYDLKSLNHYSDEMVMMENMGLIRTDANLRYNLRPNKTLELIAGKLKIRMENFGENKKTIKVIFLNRIFYDLALVYNYSLNKEYEYCIINLFKQKKITHKIYT